MIAKATVTDIHEEDGHQVAELDVVTVNQDNQPVINGKATARLMPE